MIGVVAASNYFRGLLLLIRKDRKVTPPEVELMRQIGKQLGFEEGFCNAAIDDILENPHVIDEVPLFSTKELAAKFVRDGLSLAFADGELHPSEEAWVRSTAERNELDRDFYMTELEAARSRGSHPAALEVDDLTVK